MKPNFALDLSHEGINLLHRAKGGWSLVGSVALDDPDMGARLDDLRRSAAMLESGGLTTKLIIPNSQILYTTVEASGPDDISREVQIRSALDGLTPYAVGDLVFDWRAEGDKARVAVLARETMDEAESFAVEYKFNPVSFVARPDRREFSGEPFFGKTRAANRLLGPGKRVEPDASPVPVNPRALELSRDNRVDDVPAAPPAEETPETASPPAAAEAPAPGKEKPAPTRAPKDEPRPAATANVSAPSLAPFPPTPDEVDAAPPAKPGKSKGAATPALPPTTDDEVPRPRPRITAPTPPADPTTGPSLGPLIVDDVDDASEPDLPDTAETDTAPAAFQTSRAAAPDAEATSGSQNRLKKMAARIAIPADSPGTVPKPTAPGKPGDAAPAKPRHAKFSPLARSGAGPKVDAPEPAGRGNVDRLRAGMAEALARPLPTPDKPLTPETAKPGLLSSLTGALRGFGRKSEDSKAEAAPQAEKKAPSSLDLLTKRRKKPTSAEDAKRAEEAEAMTVFGARKSQTTTGRPRYLGLILTLLLLLAMAIVAVWSTFAIDDSETSLFNPAPEDTIAADPIEDAPATPEPETDPAPDPAADPAPEPTPPVSTDTAEVLSPEAAETRYAATGIWQRAPEPLGDPQSTRLEDRDLVALTPIDPDRAPAPIPGELPGEVRDALLANPVPPPPPGASFDLDENGLVRPTPEGVLSPAGVLVYAGRPPVTPPPRPGDLPDVAPPLALPGIPDTRPLPRPADLVTTPTPSVAPEAAPGIVPDATRDLPDIILPGTDDDAALEPGDDAQPGDAAQDAPDTAIAAAPRPAPRPDDLVVSTSSPTAAIDAAVDTAVIEAAVEDAIDESIVDATELAVLVSRKPSYRPSNFAKIVDAAREASSDGSRVVAAAATTTPSIPTRANVATRATTKNAINLRDINLIGIYGTSSARRALVRLDNGRYVKVQVGDRLDGGRVTSITATELTYQKGRRALKLAVLPLG